MEKLRTFWFLSVLCLTGLNFALTQEENSYFVVGGILKLRPRISEAITNIVWKHKVNMVAEWVKDKLNEVYLPFEGRTILDETTGSLEIKNMTEAEAGLYTVEINRKVHGQRYNAIAIVKVPKPSAVVRPLTCNHASDSCTLSCDGETEGAEPVTYSWRMDGGEWEQSGKERVISKADAHGENFYCRIKNPVSEEESGPERNPFFKKKEPPNNGGIVAAVIGSLILLAAVIAAVLLGLRKKGVINCTRSVEDGKDAPSPESVPLNDGSETNERQQNSSPGNGAPDFLTGTDAHPDTAVNTAASDTQASPPGPAGGESAGDPPTQPTATPAGDHSSAAAGDTQDSPSGPAGGESAGDPPTQPTATPAGDHSSADEAQSSLPEEPEGESAKL